MKNRNISWTSMIAAIMLFTLITACNGNKDQQSGNQETHKGIPSEEMSGTPSVSEGNQQGLQSLLSDYTDIKDALVKDDRESVQKEAEDMLETIKETDKGEQIKSSVSQIAEAQDINEQRRHFAELSNQLYNLAKNNDAVDKTVYWQHCPMALDNQGANWLSFDEKISNPYMGQKMPGCGSVEETLNQ